MISRPSRIRSFSSFDPPLFFQATLDISALRNASMVLKGEGVLREASVVSLTLLYNDDEGRHPHPVSSTG